MKQIPTLSTDPLPTPPQPEPAPEPTPPTPPSPVPPRSRLVAGILIAALVASLGGLFAYKKQLKEEKTGPPVTVKIHPGEAKTKEGEPLYLSALAYDEEGRPIRKNIIYEWGMSSTESVGTLQANNDLATFYPSNRGTGDIYVHAIAPNGRVLGAVSVAVCDATSCPTAIAKEEGAVAGESTEAEE